MRRVTAAEPYSMDEARRDVFAAILRVVARDMEAEIKAGERLQREGKGTPDGLLPPEAIPLCLAATREILAEMRRRASPAPETRTAAPFCAYCRHRHAAGIRCREVGCECLGMDAAPETRMGEGARWRIIPYAECLAHGLSYPHAGCPPDEACGVGGCVWQKHHTGFTHSTSFTHAPGSEKDGGGTT